MRKFHKCGYEDCQNDAKWLYMPGYSSGCSPFVCDEHVSRGCSCNTHSVNEEYRDLPSENEIEGVDWEWLKIGDDRVEFLIENEKEYWWSLDNGRPYPCSEYEWSESGFVTEEYTKWLEERCKEIGYNLLEDEVVLNQNWCFKSGEYFWSDELIEKVEKIINNEIQNS